MNSINYKGSTYKLAEKTKTCEVCGFEVPLSKWKNHQYFLGGVNATLCKGMNAASRRYYEKVSARRLQQAKMQAKSLGYDDPEQVEMFLRGRGFAGKSLEKMKDTNDSEVITKRISVPQKW